jgi:hypothetical protein
MDLFRALTGQDKLPGIDEDIQFDYVIKTREFRKSFVLELKNQQILSLNGLQRSLAELDYVLADMLEIIEKQTEKK